MEPKLNQEVMDTAAAHDGPIEADAVIVGGELVDLLRAGAPAIQMVIKTGKVVATGSDRTSGSSASA